MNTEAQNTQTHKHKTQNTKTYKHVNTKYTNIQTHEQKNIQDIRNIQTQKNIKPSTYKHKRNLRRKMYKHINIKTRNNLPQKHTNTKT